MKFEKNAVRASENLTANMVETAEDIAVLLSAAWHRLTSETFVIQFLEIFGVELPEICEIDRFFIGLSNSGDFERRVLASNCVKWWQVDQNGVKEIDFPAFAIRKTEEVYKRPYFHFRIEGNRVLLKEVFGDDFIIRRIGKCVRTGEEWQLTFDRPGFG